MIYSCILFYSLLNGIDPKLTQAIIQVESSGRPYAIGTINEIGLMQIRPEFVPETALQLQQPCTNIMRGTAILADMKANCKHTKDNTWIICYNLGKSKAAKFKHPRLWKYYKKVIAQLNKIE